MKRGFLAKLEQFADYRDKARPGIDRATIDVTERTARRALKLKKKEPLVYRGLTLTCRGSADYRNSRADAV